MTRFRSDHEPMCDWHVDQYDWECTCGASQKKTMTEEAKPDPQDVPEADKVREILSKIEAGESERGACEAVGMNRMTFRSRALKMGAASQYAEATSALARFQVEQLEAVIEKAEAGEIDHQTARLVMDARKWMASKLFPKQWGDKIAHVGGDPETDNPIQSKISVTDAPEDVLRWLAGQKVGE